MASFAVPVVRAPGASAIATIVIRANNACGTACSTTVSNRATPVTRPALCVTDSGIIAKTAVSHFGKFQADSVC